MKREIVAEIELEHENFCYDPFQKIPLVGKIPDDFWPSMMRGRSFQQKSLLSCSPANCINHHLRRLFWFVCGVFRVCSFPAATAADAFLIMGYSSAVLISLCSSLFSGQTTKLCCSCCKRFNAWLLRMGLKGKDRGIPRKKKAEQGHANEHRIYGRLGENRQERERKMQTRRDTTLNSWEEQASCYSARPKDDA